MISIDVDELSRLFKILGFEEVASDDQENLSTVVRIKCNVSGKEVIFASKKGNCRCVPEKNKDDEEKVFQVSYTSRGVTITQDQVQQNDDSDGEPKMKKQKSMELLSEKNVSPPKSVLPTPIKNKFKLARQSTFTASPDSKVNTSYVVSPRLNREDQSRKLKEAEALTVKLHGLLTEINGTSDKLSKILTSPTNSILNVSSISIKSGCKELKRRSNSYTSSPKSKIGKPRIIGLNSTAVTERPARALPRRIPSLNLPSFAKKQLLPVSVSTGPGTFRSIPTEHNTSKTSKDVSRKKIGGLYSQIKPTISRYSSFKKS